MELIQQQPFRADAVERLQQRSQHKLLRRHRWASFCGVQLAQGGIEPIESLIRQLSNPPEWMVRRDPILDREIGEQGAAALLLSSHRRLSGCSIFAGLAGFFSELLGKARYSREELVAELGAVLLGDRLEIGSEIESHAAYLGHWIELLRESPKVLFQVLSEARQAADLICPEAEATEPNLNVNIRKVKFRRADP